MRFSLALVACLVAGWPACTALADEFDQLDGTALSSVPKGHDAKTVQRVTLPDLGALPAVFPAVGAPVFVARTDEGNLSRLVVSPALKKARKEGGAPAPILILERFDTFEAPAATSRLARGRGVVLFDGFQFDLDSGQVVPEGQGGDLVFRSDGPTGPRLETIGTARLYALIRSPLPPVPRVARDEGPGAFAGIYRVHADGRWSGSLDLTVREGGQIVGRFRSDDTGASYPVTGQVGPDPPHLARFAAALPRSRLEFEAYLWTRGHAAMAGTVRLLDRPFGFYAVREEPRDSGRGTRDRDPDASLQGPKEPRESGRK